MARKRRKRGPLRRLKREATYWAVRGIIGIFRLLPRRAALALGDTIGRMAPLAARRDYRLAVEHLTIAFGDGKSPEEIARIARKVFRNAAMNFVDTARFPVMSEDEILGIVVPHGLEHLEAAYARGHGVLSLTAHVGCWEIMGQYYTTIGMPTAAIARRLYDPRFERMLVDSRKRRGVVNITRGSDTRDIIRMLKQNHMVGVLVDQDMKVKGVFVDFFGKPAHTASAPALLSIRYAAPIVPMFASRDDAHRHHLWIEEPLEVPDTGDREEDIRLLTVACSRVTEDFIRDHPEEWVWFHRRWKTRPPGEDQRAGKGADG